MPAVALRDVDAPAPARRRAPKRVDRNRAEGEVRQAFLRMVSHELRTPLNAIIGFADVLTLQAHGPLGAPEYLTYAADIGAGGRRLLTLVNQTLELARLEGGSADLCPEIERIGPAIREAAAAAEPASGVTVEVAAGPDADALRVRVDPGALGTMLGAMVGQAVAASPPGGTVRVRARALATRVVVEVEDDGPGCAARDLSALLRPFAPGAGGGSGVRSTHTRLELPIARLLAKASGGALTLKSSPEGGMTAALSLPRA